MHYIASGKKEGRAGTGCKTLQGAVTVYNGVDYSAVFDYNYYISNNVIMPILSLVVGRLDFSNWFIALDGKHYDTLAQARASGTATVNFGMFLSGVLNFIIMAFVVFLIVKVMNRLFHGKEEPAAPTEKTCPFCKSKIPLEATRCPHCTSMLEIEE